MDSKMTDKESENEGLLRKQVASTSGEAFSKPRAIVTCLWVIACLAAFLFILVYKHASGATVQPCAEREAELPKRPNDAPYRLVMAAHPRCPCTTASVRQIERILARCSTRLAVTVLVYRPLGTPLEWGRTSLVTNLEAAKYAQIVEDEDGRIAASLGLGVSGAVVLYGPDGQSKFAGGITPGRGHEGDCRGTDVIRLVVEGKQTSASTAPVYGCSLKDPSEGRQ